MSNREHDDTRVRKVDHGQRRQDAAAAIERLMVERASIETDIGGDPAAIEAASVAAEEAAAQVAEIEERLATDMERAPGTLFAEQRCALADARSKLVEARSHLDRQTRHAAERARRLTTITQDLDSWQRRHDQAEAALIDVMRAPDPQVINRITDTNQQGYADAAAGEPLFPDADPDYAAGWHSWHRFQAAGVECLRALGQPHNLRITRGGRS